MISPTSFSDTPEASPSGTSANHVPTANPATTHDAELVRRFNSGDEDAFAEIVARHRRKMFAIALSHLRNHADAEEIAQDTFIRAYRGLARFRGDSSLASWLHSIVFNLSRNRCGYFSRRHRQETRSFDCALGEDSTATFADLVASDVPSPAREALTREFLAQVKVCMGKLNSRQREILRLRTLLNHSYEEIAKSLGLSPGTVKSRIARARENLRELLAQTYGEAEPGTASSLQWFEANRSADGLRLVGACG